MKKQLSLISLLFLSYSCFIHSADNTQALNPSAPTFNIPNIQHTQHQPLTPINMINSVGNSFMLYPGASLLPETLKLTTAKTYHELFLKDEIGIAVVSSKTKQQRPKVFPLSLFNQQEQSADTKTTIYRLPMLPPQPMPMQNFVSIAPFEQSMMPHGIPQHFIPQSQMPFAHTMPFVPQPMVPNMRPVSDPVAPVSLQATDTNAMLLLQMAELIKLQKEQSAQLTAQQEEIKQLRAQKAQSPAPQRKALLPTASPDKTIAPPEEQLHLKTLLNKSHKSQEKTLQPAASATSKEQPQDTPIPETSISKRKNKKKQAATKEQPQEVSKPKQEPKQETLAQEIVINPKELIEQSKPSEPTKKPLSKSDKIAAKKEVQKQAWGEAQNCIATQKHSQALGYLEKADHTNPAVLIAKAQCLNRAGQRLSETDSNQLAEYITQVKFLKTYNTNPQEILRTLVTMANAKPHLRWEWATNTLVKNENWALIAQAELILKAQVLRQANVSACPNVAKGKPCQHAAARTLLEKTPSDPTAAKYLLHLMNPEEESQYHCALHPKELLLDIVLAHECIETLERTKDSYYASIIKTTEDNIEQVKIARIAEETEKAKEREYRTDQVKQKVTDLDLKAKTTEARATKEETRKEAEKAKINREQKTTNLARKKKKANAAAKTQTQKDQDARDTEAFSKLLPQTNTSRPQPKKTIKQMRQAKRREEESAAFINCTTSLDSVLGNLIGDRQEYSNKLTPQELEEEAKKFKQQETYNKALSVKTAVEHMAALQLQEQNNIRKKARNLIALSRKTLKETNEKTKQKALKELLYKKPNALAHIQFQTDTTEDNLIQLDILELILAYEQKPPAIKSATLHTYIKLAQSLHDFGESRGTEALGKLLIDQDKHDEAFILWAECKTPTAEMLKVESKYWDEKIINESKTDPSALTAALDRQSTLLLKLSIHPDTPLEERAILQLKSAEIMPPQTEEKKEEQVMLMKTVAKATALSPEAAEKATQWLIRHYIKEHNPQTAFDVLQAQHFEPYIEQSIIQIKEDIKAIEEDKNNEKWLHLVIEHASNLSKINDLKMSLSLQEIREQLNILNSKIIENFTRVFDFSLINTWLKYFPDIQKTLEVSHSGFYEWYQGVSAHGQGDFESAKAHLLKACNYPAILPAAAHALGQFYILQEDYTNALLYLKKSENFSPIDSVICQSKCLIRSLKKGDTKEIKLQRFQDAWDILEIAGTIGHYWRGSQIARGMHPQESVELCRETDSHINPHCSHNKAREYWEQHALDEPFTHQDLARHYREGLGVKKNIPKAIEHARKAIELFNTEVISEECAIVLACCLQKGTPKEIDEAHTLFMKIGKQNTAFAKLSVNLALHHQQLNYIYNAFTQGIITFESYTDKEKQNLKEILTLQLPRCKKLWNTSSLISSTVSAYPGTFLDLMNFAFDSDFSNLPKDIQLFVNDLESVNQEPPSQERITTEEDLFIQQTAAIFATQIPNSNVTQFAGNCYALIEQKLCYPGAQCQRLPRIEILKSCNLAPDSLSYQIIAQMMPSYLVRIRQEILTKGITAISIQTLITIYDYLQLLKDNGRNIAVFNRTFNDTLFSLPVLNTLPSAEEWHDFTGQKDLDITPFIHSLIDPIQEQHPFNRSLAISLLSLLQTACFSYPQLEKEHKKRLFKQAKKVCKTIKDSLETNPPESYLIESWKKRIHNLDVVMDLTKNKKFFLSEHNSF
ncbi:MAG: TPR repeat protein [Alteromonas naphthalenivorans]|jgi:TPR repeat protein